MRSKETTYRLMAFSVLEVTVVIALMALLSGLFFAALNRFNEQVGNEKVIKEELNKWFAIRANLWRELDEADSVKVKEEEAFIYKDKTPVVYSIRNEHLFRKTDGEEITDLNLKMNSIGCKAKDDKKYIEFNVDWKDEEMILSYPLRSDLSDRMNNYFLAKKWQ